MQRATDYDTKILCVNQRRAVVIKNNNLQTMHREKEQMKTDNSKDTGQQKKEPSGAV